MPVDERSVWFTATMAVVGLAIAVPALAQSGPAGVLGATRPGSGGRDVLALQMAISEALDSDVAPEFRARLPGGRLPGRHSSVAAAGLVYARSRRAVQLSAATTGFFRYSYEVEQVKPGAASAHVALGLRMPGRVGTLSLSQGTSYSPSYLYQLLPGEVEDLEPDAEPPPPADPEYRIDARESLSHRTRLGLHTGRGLGWQMTTTAAYSQTDFRRSAAPGERQNWEAGTRLSYRPTRRGGFSFGYRYREASYGAGNTLRAHELPLGFSFTPALTRTRRLSFSGQVTPTMTDTFAFVTADSAGDGDEGFQPDDGFDPDDGIVSDDRMVTERRRRYVVQGDASVSYPVSLRWRLSASYLRRVQTLAVLAEPVATDGARFGLSGAIGRRVGVSIQTRYTQGASLGLRGRDVATAQGNARLSFALTRSMALSGEYLYYRYEFGDRALLAPDLPPFLERHSVRVGIAMFTQLLGR